MPNWCFNSLHIDGEKPEIEKFRAWLGGEPLTLNKIVPMPEEIRNTTSPVPEDKKEEAKVLRAKYGSDNWYDWAYTNWGTKWDIEADKSHSDDDDYFHFTFDSAWAPPDAAIKTLGTLFPNLSITMNYREDGMGFAGVVRVNGSDVQDEHYDSCDDREKYRAFMLNEYDEDPFADDEDEEEVVDTEENVEKE